MADVTWTAGLAAGGAVGAVALSAVGLDPVPLGISFVACMFGAGFAPPMGRVRQAAAFACAVVCSAVFGKYVAHHWLDASALTQAMCTAAVGLFFHPLVGYVPRLLPVLIGRRLGVPDLERKESDK